MKRTVVGLGSASKRASGRKKGIRLTETERQLLLVQLAEIMTELDELHSRAAKIAARVERSSSPRLAG